jgi:hypothetical protein
MPTPKASVVTPPAGEHIFHASKLGPLAMRWKELNASGRHEEAMEVLEEIIVESTPMFERLAQHEDYHLAVDLKVLVAAAQEKVVRWLLHWDPAKGRLFTWMSTCAKNAFRSEVAKTSQYRNRFYSTDEMPEKVFGTCDSTVDKHDVAAEVRSRIHAISSRWGSPQELGTLKYIISCLEEIQDGVHDRLAIIRGASYAYGLRQEYVRFFYTWAVTEIRGVLYERARIPLTEQDLFNASFSYTLLPDLLNNIMTWGQMRKMIALYGGMRLKIPTIAQLEKQRENYKITREIESSDMDPESVGKIARRHGKTQKSAQEIFEEMTVDLNPDRTGEYAIYDHDHGH